MKYDVNIKTRAGDTRRISITNDAYLPYDNKIAYGTSVVFEGKHAKVLGVDENGTLWFQFDGDNGACYPNIPLKNLDDFKKWPIAIIPPEPASLQNIAAKYIKEHQAQIIIQIEDNYTLQNNIPCGFYSSLYQTLRDNGICAANAPVLVKALKPLLKEEKLTQQLNCKIKFLKKDLKNTYREFAKMQLLLFQQNDQISKKLSQLEADHHPSKKRKLNSM